MFSRLRQGISAGPQSPQEVSRSRRQGQRDSPRESVPHLSPHPWGGASSSISSFSGDANTDSHVSQISPGWSLEEGRGDRQGEEGQEGGACVQEVVG